MSSFHTINPATEQVIREYSFITDEQLRSQIETTHQAWMAWKSTSLSIRSALFRELAALLRNKKATLGEQITTEMGKPLGQSIAEIEKCAWVCEYYAEMAPVFLEKKHIPTEAQESYACFAPMGVILAIMPWNFPFWQVFRFAAPGLMAGNAGLLRHAYNTMGCAIRIAELFVEAGFPKGLFTYLIASNDQIPGIISHPQVTAVTFTGSTRVGRLIGEQAGRNLKKSVLELGGSDPYIILEDADLMHAAKMCVQGRMLNTGQSCIAAKRFIVTRKNADHFTKLIREEMATKMHGDPLSDQFDLGTMARADLRDSLHQQVLRSVELGAQCILGGKIPDEPGFYYPATLLTHVQKGMPAYDEELFGPVASIIIASNEQEAFEIANDTSFGLGSGIFSSNTQRAKELAEQQLDAGSVFINTFVKSDPRLPFGGIKESGYGRELSSFGIHEFVNIKTILVQ